MKALLTKLYSGIKQTLTRSGNKPKPGISTRGIILFHHTSDVIRAEGILSEAGLDVCVKGPPPEVRTGCDMAVEFPLVSELQVRRLLHENRIRPIDMLPLQDLLLEPVSLFNIKNFGEFLMVRAANMKITIDRRDFRIVNISGGGCPDVPYLAERLVGKTLHEAPEPRSLGKTLCGYALQLAYEELRKQCHG